ncbi:MAG: hypothetical protein Q8R00_00255 [Candidatus Nanoarchaeia archaeon]|nr:hypothetical protein [Candidatus Nanoarchaeia archaeon]
MEKEWNENKLVGNHGENIIEFLVNSMPDWKCNKFGTETHIKDIKDMVRGNINPTTTKIRKMPDFIAFNKKTGETFFIEVKYSSKLQKGGYYFNYLEEYNAHWNGTKLIIVRPNKPHFIYVDLEKINDAMKKSIQTKNGWKVSWDFEGIEQEITDLFPDLKNEDVEKAMKILTN